MLINFEGINIEATRKRVKTLRLYINREGIAKLTIPLGMPSEVVTSFLLKNKEWLIKALIRSNEKIKIQKEQTQHQMIEGELFSFLGKKYPLHISLNQTITKVELKDDTLVVSSPHHLKANQLRAAVNTWYFNQLKEIITKLINHWLPIMNEHPLNATYIKVWKSRWGCMNPSKRTASFNLRLIFYPHEAIESVVVHELCHLKECSHNTYFHSLMRHYLPDYKQRELHLKGK